VKFKAEAVPRFLRAPDPRICAALIYGPDAGLGKELAASLVAGLSGDAADPFRVSELTPAVLKDDPTRLADDAAALPFTGGRRVVRLRGATDAVTPQVKDLLQGAPPGGFVVIEAGELLGRSPLRALCESSPHALAIPCYLQDEGSLGEMVVAELKRGGFSVERDALTYLVANLGGDRTLTRRELEKLALYMGGGAAEGGAVTLEDAMATVGDTAARGLDDLVFDLAEGRLAAVERGLDRQLAEGDSPISVLRAAERHFMRLHMAAGAMAGGQSADQAVAGLRPPLFFKVKTRFLAQLRLWQPATLGTALARLTSAELDCKTTGYPAETICRRVFAEIAQAARA
jgi:DNA polymerase-3 subunit delta